MVTRPKESLVKIIVDTREQRPWCWPDDQVTVRRGTLVAGDYALEGDSEFAIERKSLPDFVGTVFRDWDRFQRELERMRQAGFAARVVIIEAPLGAIMAREYPGKVSPMAVLSRVSELILSGVTVLFAGDSEQAAVMAFAIFRRRMKQLQAEQLIPVLGEGDHEA